MAVSIEAKIINGLITWFNGITLPAGVEVAPPNVNYEPTVGTPYVRLMVRKNTPQTSHIGGGKEPIRRGFFLANVNWPVAQGIVKPSELAGTIRNRFAFATVIPHDGITIRIVEEPTVQGDDVRDAFIEIPVVCPWQVYP